MSRKSLLAIRRGRRVARTFTFDSDILPSSPMEANANLTLTLTLTLSSGRCLTVVTARTVLV